VIHPLTLVQVSDLHLDPARAEDRDRFQRLHRAIEALAPDLVIASGDLTDDAYASPPIFAKVRERLETLSAPVLAIPGNHDVGNKVSVPDFPLRPSWLAMWLSAFESDRFERALGSWTLMGLNSQLLGSGLEREAEQWAWLEARVLAAERDGRSVALFTHMPPYIHQRDEPSTGGYTYWNVDPAPRRRLLEILDRPAVKLLAHGHLHWFRQVDRGRTRWVACPSISIAVDDPLFPRGGDVLGFVHYRLGPETFEAELIQPPLPQRKVHLRRPSVRREDGEVTRLHELIIDAAVLPAEPSERLARRLEPLTHGVRVTVLSGPRPPSRPPSGQADRFPALPLETACVTTAEARAALLATRNPAHTICIVDAHHPPPGLEAAAVTIGVGDEGTEHAASVDALAADFDAAIELILEPGLLALRLGGDTGQRA